MNLYEREKYMSAKTETEREAIWLSIERRILELSSSDLTEENLEGTIHRVAEELDEEGHNVSRHGGHMLQLRSAVEARLAVGRPLIKDLDEAIAGLTLEDVADARLAALKLVNSVGEVWPKLKQSARTEDVLQMVEKTRLDLLFEKAKSLPGDEGIRFLIAENIASRVITEGLEVSESRLKEVYAAIESERRERIRVEELLAGVDGKPVEERIEHLINNKVSDEWIVELAKVDQAAIDDVKKAMVEALEQQRRQEEEAAARRKAEAEGPSLQDIAPEQMLEYIESIREILEFSDKENEIRVMCEQSNIPKSLVEVVVTEPDRLDELEEKAEG
jgi:hypothetical protein